MAIMQEIETKLQKGISVSTDEEVYYALLELVKDKATKEPLVGYNADKENLMGKICGMLKAKGFSTYTHENIIIVAPPLIIKEDELRTAMTMLDEVLTEVDKVIA